jgi:hypothetical protein
LKLKNFAEKNKVVAQVKITDEQIIKRFNKLRQKYTAEDTYITLSEELFYSPSYIPILVNKAAKRTGIKRYGTKHKGAPKCRGCDNLIIYPSNQKGKNHYKCTLNNKNISSEYALTCSPMWCPKRKEE